MGLIHYCTYCIYWYFIDKVLLGLRLLPFSGPLLVPVVHWKWSVGTGGAGPWEGRGGTVNLLDISRLSAEGEIQSFTHPN